MCVNVRAVQIEVRAGISFVDLSHAKMNLVAQLGQLTFDQARNRTAAVWESELSRLTIGGVSDDETVWECCDEFGRWFGSCRGHIAAPVDRCVRDQVKVYSALYRTFMSPTIYSEADGSYLGFDEQVHSTTAVSPQFRFVSDLSLWDIHRSQYPW